MTKLLLLSLLLLVTLQKTSASKPVNVTYDQRALIIDGQRRMLISAGIHYPRAVPEMWPDILANAKEGGADVVQTYVFWDGHEPQQGTFNFEGRYDLVKFAQLVMEAGLYLHLRIGPYVCAEWNFGGFPVWLRDVPGIVFRTDNEPYKSAMEGFVTKIVDMMKENQLFAWQGGPIVLAQIENEYGNIEWEFGDGGKRYVDWAAKLALGLNTGVPWIMCQQNDAPGNIINTCNGYYCDQWKPNAATKPKFWTEDWNGWYQDWGQSTPHRPVEDNAFAVARFFQLGGSFHNYYMYYGGTNFARTAGGPFITTSYDYDAPIDEYGFIRQPKWGHLKELHAAIKLCEPALTAIDGAPTYVWLGSNQEAHVYSGAGHCAAFLANIDNSASATVQFEGQSYVLPSWSVSILPDCKNVVFNTAQVSTQTTLTSMRKSLPKPTPEILMPSSAMPDEHISDEPLAGGGLRWQSSVEPIGIRNSRTITSNALLEQINITKDKTDYLWYSTSITVPEDDLESLKNTGSQAQLVLETMRDTVHIFVNGQLTGSALGWNVEVVQPVTLQTGNNSIDLLSMTMGLQNYGAFMETWGAGISGSVLVTGLPSGDQDLSAAKWVYQVGLQGEDLQIFSKDAAGNVTWGSPSVIPNGGPLTWYKTTFDAPGGTEPVAIDLGTMGKGQAWVNGKHLGRFWPSLLAPQSGCSWCDYRGAYSPSKCRTNCGEPSQRWYHIPRAWLVPTDNLLVLFEEIGGDPSQISVVTRSPDIVCGRVSESHPPPLQLWAGNHTRTEGSLPSPELQLECARGHHIVDVTFASFGNPVGSCGEHFGLGKCHSVDTMATVHKTCIGKQRCSLTVNWQTFGDSDPCPSITKSLAVQSRCSSDNQGPTMEEPVKYLHYPWQRSEETSNHPARNPTLSSSQYY